ncbi:hypothetical protein [Hymenobacter sp. UYP22]|uniref:hypothetical protein n=1 Tax=Hymenobacter sp. UYP22 TaxID=3156348 RepID=UPI003394330B
MKTYLFVLIALLCSCEREERPIPEQVPFIFQIPLTISPSKDTVSVGDTLWLKASFPDTVREFYSGKYYTVKPTQFDWMTSIAMRKLVYSNQYLGNQLAAANNFSYINKIGTIKPNNTFSDLRYEYINKIYTCKIGIIPKQKGIYAFNFGDNWNISSNSKPKPDLSFIKLDSSKDNMNRQAVYQSVYYYINDKHTNFYLVKANSLYASLNYPDNSNINYEQEGSYAFVVR